MNIRVHACMHGKMGARRYENDSMTKVVERTTNLFFFILCVRAMLNNRKLYGFRFFFECKSSERILTRHIDRGCPSAKDLIKGRIVCVGDGLTRTCGGIWHMRREKTRRVLKSTFGRMIMTRVYVSRSGEGRKKKKG